MGVKRYDVYNCPDAVFPESLDDGTMQEKADGDYVKYLEYWQLSAEMGLLNVRYQRKIEEYNKLVTALKEMKANYNHVMLIGEYGLHSDGFCRALDNIYKQIKE